MCRSRHNSSPFAVTALANHVRLESKLLSGLFEIKRLATATGLLILNMCCPFFVCRASSLGNKYKELYCSLCEHILIREFSNRHLQEISTSALVNRRIVNLRETVPRPAQNKQAIIPSPFLSLTETWCQLYRETTCATLSSG